jgi:hypothetical protein
MNSKIRIAMLTAALVLGLTAAGTANAIRASRESHTAYLGTVLVLASHTARSNPANHTAYLGTIEVKPSADQAPVLAANLARSHGGLSTMTAIKYVAALVFARVGG